MTITCVIVSFNNGEYLRQAVESVVVQTRTVDEIIIADDASSDGSRELIRALAAEHQEIRVIFREKNLGVNRNRDLATRAAAGDFVTFLDGDDFYYDNKIALEWQALEAANAGVACSNIDVVDAGGTLIEVRDFSAFVGMPWEDKVKLLALRPGTNPRDFLMPKKIYQQVGGFRSKFALYGDVDFKIRLAALPVKWVWSGCVGAAFRRTGSGLSSAPVKEHATALRLLLAENETLLTEVLGARGYRRALKVVPPGRVSKAEARANAEAKRYEALEQQLLERTKQLKQTQKWSDNLQRHLDAVYASRSWRVTAPLRLIMRTLRHARHGHGGNRE